MKYIGTVLLILLFISCGSPKTLLYDEHTFKIDEYAVDTTYGYSLKNPVKVGGAKENVGPLNERRFLNALCGPNGEEIVYERLGSVGAGRNELTRVILDKYRLLYKQADKEVEIILYLNMYQSGKLKVPTGLKSKY